MSARQRFKSSKYIFRPELGVKSDFEKLLQRFSSTNTVRYKQFAEIWSDMKFSMYCAGRQSHRETREFVEECFKIAVQFWLPPSSFLIRAGALYLLYGLYYFQLVAPKVKIRMTPADWQKVVEFHDEARQQQHLDLDYIFQKLLLDKAFVFAATQDEILPNTRELDESKLVPEVMKEESSSVAEVFSSTALNQLSLVHDQYQKMKVALTGKDSSIPDSSLNIAHHDFIQGIYKTLQSHREKCYSTQAQISSETISEDMPDGQKNIKKKAYQTSLGFYKSSRRKRRHHEQRDSTGDSGSQDEKLEQRGRKKTVRLFEEDDLDPDSKMHLPDSKILMNMPDLDTIVPKNTSDKTATTGKAPLKGKKKIKGKWSAITKDESKDEEFLDKSDTSKSKVLSDLDASGKAENRKGPARKGKRKVAQADDVASKVKLRKVGTKKKTAEDDVSDRKSSDVSGDHTHSAQEKLNEKLNKRKKQARQTRQKKSSRK